MGGYLRRLGGLTKSTKNPSRKSVQSSDMEYGRQNVVYPELGFEPEILNRT